MHITAYGHTIDRAEPDEGDYITDVVILARCITVDEHGTHGSVLASTTTQTDVIVESGLITARAAMLNTGWVAIGDIDDGEDQ